MVASGLPLLYRSSGSEELLFSICSVNGIFKNDHGFLAAARGVFPSSEFLDLSTGKLSWKCGDEQHEAGPLLRGGFSRFSLAGT